VILRYVINSDLFKEIFMSRKRCYILLFSSRCFKDRGEWRPYFIGWSSI